MPPSFRSYSPITGAGGTSESFLYSLLNGSFVSSKETPNDFDLVFSYDAATETLIRSKATARALTDYQVCRTLGFLGDIFALPASLGLSSPAFSGLDMFDFDRQGTPKGVIEVQR